MPERDDDLQQPGGPDEAALAIVARHALHDEELVAALAAGTLEAEDEADERARARSFIDRCPACRALHDDVAAIGAAVRAAATFSATAPRDYRLTVEDALRLGGTVVSRGGIGRFRRALLEMARPIGASVAALGLVGVLVGSAVIGAAGLGARPAYDTGSTSGGVPGASEAAAAAPSSFEAAVVPGASPAASDRVKFGPDEANRDAAASPTTWLFVVSVLAILGGIGLFLYGARAAPRRGAPGR